MYEMGTQHAKKLSATHHWKHFHMSIAFIYVSDMLQQHVNSFYEKDVSVVWLLECLYNYITLNGFLFIDY